MSELLFGADVRPSAQMAVAIVNTSPSRSGHEGLTDTEVLIEMGRRYEIYYRPDGGAAELHGIRMLRERLEHIVATEDLSQRMATLNELFYSAAAIPQIVMHEEDPRPHFHYTLADATYVDHIKGISAYAFSRLIIMDEFGRLKTCSGDACNLLFFDVTRNGKRLYCDSRTCGNRAHAARFRSRRESASARES